MDEFDLRKDGFRPVPGVTMPAGVYALLNHGAVVYVGVSKNVYNRLVQHEVARKRRKPVSGSSRAIPFNAVLVKFCPIHEARILEAELINSLRPKYNTTIPELIKDQGINIEALAREAGIEWKESEPWKRSSRDWTKPERYFRGGR
jgi:hypothetical protein